jgi:protein phosphatase 2C family protein 2/3
VHHNFDDSDSYDIDDQKQGKSFGIGGYKGRIIFLGDGTEVLTDSDDTEMFDNPEEDKDLVSQVSKGTSTSQDDVGGGNKTAEVGGPSSTPQQAGTTAPAAKVDEKKNGGADTKAAA